jgi:hypothetical protein
MMQVYEYDVKKNILLSVAIPFCTVVCVLLLASMWFLSSCTVFDGNGLDDIPAHSIDIDPAHL